MKKIKNRLTCHEEGFLGEMEPGKLYGPGATPFHSLRSCPRGIHMEILVKLVNAGYLLGLGPHATQLSDGERYVYGYDLVMKLRDPNEERKAELLASFKAACPDAKIVNSWHAGTTMRIVTTDGTDLTMWDVIGIEHPDEDTRHNGRFYRIDHIKDSVLKP